MPLLMKKMMFHSTADAVSNFFLSLCLSTSPFSLTVSYLSVCCCGRLARGSWVGSRLVRTQKPLLFPNRLIPTHDFRLPPQSVQCSTPLLPDPRPASFPPEALINPIPEVPNAVAECQLYSFAQARERSMKHFSKPIIEGKKHTVL